MAEYSSLMSDRFWDPSRGFKVLCSFHSIASGPSSLNRFQVEGCLSATTTKLRDIRRWRIRILLDRGKVFLDRLQRGLRNPAEQSCDYQVLVRIHFDVVDDRVASQRRAGRGNAWLSLRSPTGRMNVGEVDAPLFPSHGHQVGADEAQQGLTASHLPK
jgi:hypothetical protein